MPIDFRASQIQTNKLIATGSTGTETGAQIIVYSHLADDGTSPNQGYIDQSVFVTSSIGSDIFLYVSGGIGERNVGGAQSISVFGGDVYVSGNLAIENGFSASLQQLPSGIPYLLAGPNVTINTNSLGQVEVSSSGGGGGGGGGSSFYRLEVLDYYATNNISDTTAGQVIFPANQFTGSLVLYGIIANSDATATGSVRLYNVSSGSYVEIGGVGNEYLLVSGTTPTIVTSVDLISASNFNSSSQAIYELQVSSSNGASTAFFGGFELRPSGSFTGNTYISASNVYYYVSGTWEDGGNKLATTASVAITGLQGPGFFADNVGSDVFFYVSGNNGGVAAGNGVSVFGGDVVISGTLFGGSPLKIGTRINVNGASNGDNNGNTIEFDNSSSFGGRIQTANNTVISSIGQGNLGLTLNAGNDNVNGPGGGISLFGGYGASSFAAGGFGGDGGNIFLNGGYGGYGFVGGGQGGGVILYAANGGAGGTSGGNGGGCGLYGNEGGFGSVQVGSPGSVELVGGYGTYLVNFPGISGARGGNANIIAGAGSSTFNAPAGPGGDIYIIAGSPGIDDALGTFPLYEFTGSGKTYILGGINRKDINYLSGSELTIGSDFYSYTPEWTQKFKRVFINRTADADRAAFTGEPSPNDIGDVFFFVSGGIGQKDGSAPAVALFGGDVVISGVLHGGSPLKIGTSILQNPNNNSIDTGTDNYNVILASDGNSYITGANATGNAIISSVVVGIEGENIFADRNSILSSQGVTITTNGGNGTILNSVHGSVFVTLDDCANNSVNGGAFITINSSSYQNSINSSLAIIATSASLINGTLAAGDATNLFSPTISIIENSWGSAIIAGGPNFISSSDGNPIINSAIIGSNWVITSSRTYAIGDTVNPAKVLMSASNGVDITGDLNVTGSFAVSSSGISNGTLNQYNGLRYYPTIVTSLPHTASLNDYIIGISASAGPGIELPASEYGRTFIVKDVSGSATADNIIITAAGGELIDGLPAATIGIDYGSYKFVYFGSGIGWGMV